MYINVYVYIGFFRAGVYINILAPPPMFSFLWLFPDIGNEDITAAASTLGKKYPGDLNGNILSSQMVALKQVYDDNFQKGKPVPHKLQNELCHNGLEEVYDEVATALRIFLTIPGQ